MKTRICPNCEKEFTPSSPNQKKHTFSDFECAGETCFLIHEIEYLTDSSFKRVVGMTREKYNQYSKKAVKIWNKGHPNNPPVVFEPHVRKKK